MSLILINASLGEGKDTFYQLFTKHSKKEYSNKKFAYKLKQIIALLTGCTVEDLESEDFKNSYLPEIWNTKITDKDGSITIKRWTYREVLQYFGTDLSRDKFHPDVHINAFYADYVPVSKAVYHSGKYVGKCIQCKEQMWNCDKRQHLCQTCVDKYNSIDLYPDWIVTDCRFPNEFDSGKQHHAVTIKVIRYMSPINWLNSKYFNEIKLKPEARKIIIGSTVIGEHSVHKLAKMDFITFLKEKDLILDPENDKNWLKLIHSSETSLLHYYNEGKFDYVLHNNGTLEELEEKIKKIVSEIEA
jgi:hypothetical protein